MRKTLSILTILMFMLATVVIAPPPVPAPVRGYFYINGESTNGYIVQVTNGRTGEVISGATISSLVTEPGGFAFDMGMFKQGVIFKSQVYVGDPITVKIIKTPLGQDFNHAQGELTFNANFDQTITQVTIRVDDQEVQQPTTFQCASGDIVFDLVDCPVISPPTPTPDVPVENRASPSQDRNSASVDVFFGQVINLELDNNKISKLLNEEIYFDGDNYDIKETVFFNGVVKTSIDDEDFGLKPYLIVQEAALEYNLIFKEEIILSDITEEDPLEIVFLGKKLEIISATENSLKFRIGEKVTIDQGEEVEFFGKTILVEGVTDTSVSLTVNGETKTIQEDSEKEINGLHIFVEEAFAQDYTDGIHKVDLIVGEEEIDDTVKDGEDFELFIKDAEEFEWIISLASPNQYIGVLNKEAYNDVDEDEDYQAISLGESLSLPNNYLPITFDSVTEVDYNDLTLKVREGYLVLKGDEDVFSFGSKDYDDLYINENGIYDKDEVLITTTKVEIGDSDIFVELGSVKIADLTIELDLSDILHLGISYKTEEENFVDHLGIIFRDPENAVEDRTGFKISVPEDRPEALVVFGGEGVIEDDDVIVPTPEPTPVEPIEPVDESEFKAPEPVEIETPIVEPTPVVPETPVEDEPIEDEEIDSLFDKVFQLAVKILAVFGFGAGFLGLVNHYWEGGQKFRAIKMLNTAIQKALLGKYDKYKKK